MNITNKSTIILIFVIAILLGIIAGLSVFILLSKKNTVPQQQQESAEKQTNQPITIQDKKITDTTAPFTIDITYPYIQGYDDFNANVQDIINKEMNDFKTNSMQNDAAVKQSDPAGYAKYPPQYNLTISYTKGEIDDNAISIMFNVSNFEGGAHGANYFVPLNYNPTTKQEIALADLFPGQSDYVTTISNYCVQNLTTQIQKALGSTDGTWIEQGAGPQVDNFSVFLINTNSLTFYFPQYQVAPYSAGDFEVVMPR